MGKDKLRRFEENKSFKCLFQPEFEEVFRKDYYIKGRWQELYFENGKPIVLELGCGRGEYTIDMAKRYPDKNFIGMDIKGARLWRGVKSATEAGKGNAAFLRTRIEFIDQAGVHLQGRPEGRRPQRRQLQTGLAHHQGMTPVHPPAHPASRGLTPSSTS